MHLFWPYFPAIAVAIFASGCAFSPPAKGWVTVYQPLVSLQRSTALEESPTNFAGQRMLIQCVPSADLKPADAQRLCTKVSSLFSNQGAEVEIAVPQAGAGVVSNSRVGGKRPDLVVELRTRRLHDKNPTILWAACIYSCSIIPARAEYSIAQDISIRDADGFELVSDTLQARFVHYWGGGIWIVNKTLDWLVREPSEELTGGAAERDFSRDFYRQINQLAFNARVRAAVLREFEPVAKP